MNVSKSQARRIASQTDTVDVNLLQGELAMANGHIEYLRGEVERLQADQTILLATAQDALECLVDWASYADEYFLVKHDFKGDVQRISSVTDRFRRNLQSGDSDE